MKPTLIAFSLALSLASGCSSASGNGDGGGGGDGGRDLDETSLVTVARHTAGLASQTASLAIIAVDPLAAGVANANEAATRVAAAASGYFDNSSCVTTAINPQSPNRVLLTFNDCEGPYGFVNVTGQVAFQYAREGAGLSVSLLSVGAITVDEIPLDFSTTVTIANLANPRAVAIETMNHLGLSDLPLALSGRGSLAWDGALCFTLSGDLTATAGNSTLSTTIDGLRRCARGCPNGDVSLSVTSGTSATIRVVFDGDRTGEIILTTPRNMRRVPVPIVCL